jgi:methylmalonyl-CoA mutase C-terminal domain/subunit
LGGGPGAHPRVTGHESRVPGQIIIAWDSRLETRDSSEPPPPRPRQGDLTMPEERKIRVLAAKPGLDGHDRGVKVICAALRDAGMEVIYTGLRQTPEQIVAAAIQEDVDVIAMSVLSGAHNYLFPRVMELLREKGITDVLVMGGGIIPEEDVPALKQAGIAAIFGPGTDTGNIVNYIRENLRKR